MLIHLIDVSDVDDLVVYHGQVTMSMWRNVKSQ